MNAINPKTFAFFASIILLTGVLGNQALATKRVPPKQIPDRRVSSSPSPAPTAEASNCTITVTTVFTNDDVREQIFTPHMDTQKDCERVARMHEHAVTKGVKSKSATAEWEPQE